MYEIIRETRTETTHIGIAVLILMLIAVAWMPPVKHEQNETMTSHPILFTTVPVHQQNITLIPGPEQITQNSTTNASVISSNESLIEGRRVRRNPVVDAFIVFMDLIRKLISRIIDFFASGLTVNGNMTDTEREGQGNPYLILPFLGFFAGILAYVYYLGRKRKLRILLRQSTGRKIKSHGVPGTSSSEGMGDPLTRVVIKLAKIASGMLGMEPSVITHRESLIVAKNMREDALRDEINEVITLYEQWKFANKEVGHMAYELAEKILEKLGGGDEV